MHFVTARPAAPLAALAAAGLTALSLAAPAASAAPVPNFVPNGSFEQDPVGTTGVPSGFNSLQDGVSAVIVGSGPGITDGTQAVRLSATLINEGRYSALVYSEQFPPNLVDGETYDVGGDFVFTGGGSGGVQFIDYDDTPGSFNFGEANFTRLEDADGNARFVTAADGPQSLRGSFTYRGGAIAFQAQFQSFAGAPRGRDARGRQRVHHPRRRHPDPRAGVGDRGRPGPPRGCCSAAVAGRESARHPRLPRPAPRDGRAGGRRGSTRSLPVRPTRRARKRRSVMRSQPQSRPADVAAPARRASLPRRASRSSSCSS